MSFRNQRVSPNPLPKLYEMDGRPCPEGGGSGKVVEELILNPCFSDESHEEKNGCLRGEKRSGFMSNHSGVQEYPSNEIRAAWSNGPEESMKRNHACNRVALLAVFLMSVASLLLTVLMLFGKIGRPNCVCLAKSDPGTELLKNVQDLQQNVTSLRRVSVEKPMVESVNEMSRNLTVLKEETDKTTETITTELEDMKLKYERLQEQIKLMEGRISAVELNVSASSLIGDQSNDLTALWLAVNSTNKMLHGLSSLWTAVNASNNRLSDVRMQVIELDYKVRNNSNKTGPRGPPGYNGTQGPAGTPGSQGSPGPPGRGSNITLCAYKKASSTGTKPKNYATQDISKTESVGTKFLGVNCDTNDARVTRLSSTAAADGRRTYKCACSNTLGTGDAKMYCYIHYWECQTNT